MALMEQEKGGFMRNIWKTESGRTMSETLATLVVMGILTIGGVVGIKYAMEVHKENESIDWVVKTIVGSRTGFLLEQYGEKAEKEKDVQKVPIAEVISGVPFNPAPGAEVSYSYTTPLGSKVSVDVINKYAFEVDMANVSYGVCIKLLNGPLEYQCAYKRDDRKTFEVLPDSSKEEKAALCAKIDPKKRTPFNPEGDESTEDPWDLTMCFSSNSEHCVGKKTSPQTCGRCEKFDDVTSMCQPCSVFGTECDEDGGCIPFSGKRCCGIYDKYTGVEVGTHCTIYEDGIGVLSYSLLDAFKNEDGLYTTIFGLNVAFDYNRFHEYVSLVPNFTVERWLPSTNLAVCEKIHCNSHLECEDGWACCLKSEAEAESKPVSPSADEAFAGTTGESYGGEGYAVIGANLPSDSNLLCYGYTRNLCYPTVHCGNDGSCDECPSGSKCVVSETNEEKCGGTCCPEERACGDVCCVKGTTCQQGKCVSPCSECEVYLGGECLPKCSDCDKCVDGKCVSSCPDCGRCVQFIDGYGRCQNACSPCEYCDKRFPGGICSSEGILSCGSTCCREGENECVDDKCCPISQACGNTCCASHQKCTPSGCEDICSTENNETYCSGKCCAPHETCYWGSCVIACDEGEIACGDVCCPSGATCHYPPEQVLGGAGAPEVQDVKKTSIYKSGLSSSDMPDVQVGVCSCPNGGDLCGDVCCPITQKCDHVTGQCTCAEGMCGDKCLTKDKPYCCASKEGFFELSATPCECNPETEIPVGCSFAYNGICSTTVCGCAKKESWIEDLAQDAPVCIQKGPGCSCLSFKTQKMVCESKVCGTSGYYSPPCGKEKELECLSETK